MDVENGESVGREREGEKAIIRVVCAGQSLFPHDDDESWTAFYVLLERAKRLKRE